MADKKSVRIIQDSDQFTFKSLIWNKPVTILRKQDFFVRRLESKTSLFGFSFMYNYKAELTKNGINKTFTITSNIDLVKHLQSCNFK